jgi:hypothetical protein
MQEKKPKTERKERKRKRKKLNFLVQGLEDVSIIGQVFKNDFNMRTKAQ